MPSRDEDQPRTRPIGLVLALAFGGLLLAFAAGGAVAYFALRSKSTAAQEGASGVKAEPKAAVELLTRKEFEALIWGKTGDEVIALIGRPERTSPHGQQEYWYYKNKTYDPVSGKPDGSIQITLSWGSVSRVSY